MAVSSTQARILALKSGGKCAFPGCDKRLVFEAKRLNASKVLGEIAHIRGENPGAARYDSEMTQTERDSERNLIYLCPSHHTMIDKAPEDFTFEWLLQKKDEHESSVRRLIYTQPRRSFQLLHYPKNPFFTGRKAELDQIRKLFQKGNAFCVISGLGGVGKTQLANEYAHEFRASYECIFWCDADSSDSLFQSCTEICGAVGLPIEESYETTMYGVRAWLTEHSGWLCIFDNVNDQTVIQKMLPLNGNGNILITSRTDNFQRLGIIETLHLAKLPPEDARRFLIKRTASVKSEEDKVRTVDELAKELDFLPLALEQASAYMVAHKIGVKEYLGAYASSRSNLLKTSFPAIGEYSDNVFSTWSQNILEIAAKHQTAYALLKLFSFLGPSGIPLSLIANTAEFLGPDISKISEEDHPQFHLKIEIEPLTRFSLVGLDPSRREINIHRIVQLVVRSLMSPSDRVEWGARALTLIGSLFPKAITREALAISDQLAPHANAAIAAHDELKLELPIDDFLWHYPDYLRVRCQSAHAESILRKLLGCLRRFLPSNHTLVLACLHRIGGTCEDQGNLSEARICLEQALAIASGSTTDRAEIAIALNNLGVLCEKEKKLEDAEGFYQKALTYHPDKSNEKALITQYNLGYVYVQQGRYSEGEKILSSCLAVWNRNGPPSERYLRSCLSTLAIIAEKQNKLPQAVSLLKRALHLHDNVYGAESGQANTLLHELGRLYFLLGSFRECIACVTRVLQVVKTRPEAENAQDGSTVNLLIEASAKLNDPLSAVQMLHDYFKTYYDRHGKIPVEALETFVVFATLFGKGVFLRKLRLIKILISIQKLFEKSEIDLQRFVSLVAKDQIGRGEFRQANAVLQCLLAMEKKIVPPNYRNRCNIFNLLGSMARKQKRETQAVQHFEDALRCVERAGCADVSDHLATLNNISSVRFDQKKYGECEKTMRKALRLVIAGKCDALTRGLAKANLAFVLFGRKKLEEGESLLVEAVDDLECVDAPFDETAITSAYSAIASHQMEHGQQAEAIATLKRCVAVLRTLKGLRKSAPASIEIHLATLLGRQGDTKQALKYLESAVETLDADYGPDHLQIGIAFYLIGEIAFREKRYEEAQTYLSRSFEICEPHAGKMKGEFRKVVRGYIDVLAQNLHWKEAKEKIKLLVEESEKRSDAPELARCFAAQGVIEYSLKEFKESEQSFQRAISVFDAAPKRYRKNLVPLAAWIGLVLCLQKKYHAAERRLRCGIAIIDTHDGPHEWRKILEAALKRAYRARIRGNGTTKADFGSQDSTKKSGRESSVSPFMLFPYGF